MKLCMNIFCCKLDSTSEWFGGTLTGGWQIERNFMGSSISDHRNTPRNVKKCFISLGVTLSKFLARGVDTRSRAAKWKSEGRKRERERD